jgi:hypothetical protein
MHVDSSDNIYVTDFYNYAVRKYDTSLVKQQHMVVVVEQD